MKKLIVAVIIIVTAVLSFLAGWQHAGKMSGSANGPAEREILYYTDPMNPGFRSAEPGVAPCGMPLEPVYAETGDNAAGAAQLAAGAVRVNATLQQAIGVVVEPVEMAPMTYSLRLYGRIVPDETKLYRINAATDSWVREISDMTTGSIVKRDQVLAQVLAPAFYNAQVTYLVSLDNVDRIMRQLGGELRHQQADLADNQIRVGVQALQNLGITDAQIEELASSRKAQPYLQVRSPVDGVILSRNLTLYQWFEAGSEFFDIADIGRVWVYADVYEDEAMHLAPGMPVQVLHKQMNKIFDGKIGMVLPLFDPISKTLKVRVDVDNPGYDLRPDMFVDVEIPITLPAALHVPADAVIDSGTQQVVYVDKGNNVFEPRRVETGWRLGRRIEITGGLMPGEKVVVSGNFLIDSESRMRTAAGGDAAVDKTRPLDPVCGMLVVDLTAAQQAGRTETYQDKSYYFCSDKCKESFAKNPQQYVSQTDPSALQKDQVCGMGINAEEAKKSDRVVTFQDKTFYFCSDECKNAFLKDPQKYAAKLEHAGMARQQMPSPGEQPSWRSMLGAAMPSAESDKDGNSRGKGKKDETISLGDPNVVDWKGVDKDGNKLPQREWRKGWGSFPGAEYLGLKTRKLEDPEQDPEMQGNTEMAMPPEEESGQHGAASEQDHEMHGDGDQKMPVGNMGGHVDDAGEAGNAPH